jgi:methyl-accepting chemotaxis protein
LHTKLQDEIGAMARTVFVFRDTMIERQRLAMTEEETSRRREKRQRSRRSDHRTF